MGGFEHAVANGAASAAAPSEAHPKEEREDASDERCRSIAGVRAVLLDDDQLAAASSCSALALPVAAARYARLRAAPAVAHQHATPNPPRRAEPAPTPRGGRRRQHNATGEYRAKHPLMRQVSARFPSSHRPFRSALACCARLWREQFRGSRRDRRCSLCAHPLPLSCTL